MSTYWVCDIHKDNGEGSFSCTLCQIEEMAEFFNNTDIDIINGTISFKLKGNLVVDKPMCIGRPE